MESVNFLDNSKSGISDWSIKINNKFADFEDSTFINSLKLQNTNCDDYVNELLKNEETQIQKNLPSNMNMLKDSKKFSHAPRKINNKRTFQSSANETKNESKQENSSIEAKSMILYHELQEDESIDMTESVQFDEKEQIKTETENTLFNSNIESQNKTLKNQTETQPIELQTANEPYSVEEPFSIQLETAVTEINETSETEKVTSELNSTTEKQLSIQLNAVETEIFQTQKSEKVTNEPSSKEEQFSIQLNEVETETNETKDSEKVTNESNATIENQSSEQLGTTSADTNQVTEAEKVTTESTEHQEETEPTSPTDNLTINDHVEYVNVDTDASSKIAGSNSFVVESQASDDSKPKQQINQSFSMPQPPKIVPPSVRYKRYKQLANRRNIATSPISTLNLEELEAESKRKQEQHEPKEPPNPPKAKKKKKTKVLNFLKRTDPTKQQNERLPTPPQIHHQSKISKINQKRTAHISRSESNRSTSKKPFEIPSPQVVLDIDAVRNQFGRGKIELLPLVKRIENDTINSQHSMNSILRSNEINSNDLINNIENYNKKHIFLPISSKYTGNQSARRNMHEQTARISRRRLNNYENSEMTPRQHIPNFNKRHSNVENCKK